MFLDSLEALHFISVAAVVVEEITVLVPAARLLAAMVEVPHRAHPLLLIPHRVGVAV
jgi:hypothetical protein